MNLIPEIRKYFSFHNNQGVMYPEKCKRPYMSIIRLVLKHKYKIIGKDYRIYNKNENIKHRRTCIFYILNEIEK